MYYIVDMIKKEVNMAKKGKEISTIQEDLVTEEIKKDLKLDSDVKITKIASLQLWKPWQRRTTASIVHAYNTHFITLRVEIPL